MRCAILLLVIAAGGCDWVLGLRSIPAKSDAPIEGLDSPTDVAIDVAIDAPITCPPDYVMDPVTHGRYRVDDTIQTPFRQAEMRCEQDGATFTGHTHLLVIESAAELALVAGTHWVGLTDLATANSWIWVTHEMAAVDMTYWASGEPDMATVQDCVVITTNKLDTISCLQSHGFICECDDYAADKLLFP